MPTGGGEDGSDSSPHGTLTSADMARLRARNNNKLTTLFPFGKGSEKQDQLLEMLNSYSMSLPPMPGLVDMDFHKVDPTCFSLEPRWTHIVRQHSSEMGTNLKDQQEATWELVTSEVEYIRRLRIIIDLYMCCLLHLQEAIILNEIETEKIFSNILKVYEVNCKFWEQHISPMVQQSRKDGSHLDPTMLYDGFMQFEVTFEPYAKYCCEQNVSLEYIRKKMNENELFKVFIAWAESQKLCDRLRLTDLVVIPMQRLTKYKLLLVAILKKTECEDHRAKLAQMIEKVDQYVTQVNTALHQSEEKARLSAIINRIESYDVIDAPNEEVAKLVGEFCRLDLTCPLPGCLPHQRRHLLMEGLLKLKDTNTRMDVYCFLFTDMLLISKPTKRGGNDRVKVIRAPMRLDKVVVTGLRDPASFLLIYLNEYHLASSVYTLSGSVDAKWLEHIKHAQDSFCEMRRKALEHTENEILYADSNDELEDEYGFVENQWEAEHAELNDPDPVHKPPSHDDVLVLSPTYGIDDDPESSFCSPHMSPPSFQPYSHKNGNGTNMTHYLNEMRAVKLNQRRMSRNEKRYHTADSIQDMQKQRDASIHKRLSWNFGGYHENEDDPYMFTSTDSLRSMPSSSGVSSSQSLHLVADSELADQPITFQAKGSRGSMPDFTSQGSMTDIHEHQFDEEKPNLELEQRKKMTHAQILKLKKRLLLNSTLEASEV